MPTRSSYVLVVAAIVGLVALVGASPAAAARRRAFATSVSGNGNLSSWAEAGGLLGVAAADEICRARAEAGGQPNAEFFVAWLSAPTLDAYCRVQGRTGTKANGCNGGSFPAGPWFNVSGLPMTGTLAELTGPEGIIYRGVLRDEFNEEFEAANPVTFWTGTQRTGAAASETCSGWVVGQSGVHGRVGDTLSTAGEWTSATSTSCHQLRRLLCLETGIGEADPQPQWSPGAIVFTTSVAGTGDLSSWPEAGGESGLEAGDAICRTLAAAARLPEPESFVAWLSDSTLDARDRLTLLSAPLRRLDGFLIANSIFQLLGDRNLNSLHVDEYGRYLVDQLRSYTGTLGSGTATGGSCDDWTSGSASATGTRGSVARMLSGEWSASSGGGNAECVDVARLYCFAQVVTIFWDGFDQTGDAGRWSSVTP